MPYIDDHVQAMDESTGGFREQLAIAMRSAAIDIAGEAESDPPKNHRDAARHSLAVSVLLDDGTWLPRFALAAVADGALSGVARDAAGDTAVKNRLAAIWDDLADIETKYR